MGHPPTSLRSRVLLVESNAIIGLDLADQLDSRGYEIAGPFTCISALGWLESDTPDVAVLDADLRSGTCAKLTHELIADGVPVLIFSAHDQRHAPIEFRHLPWLSMPAPVDALHTALRVLLLGREMMIAPTGRPQAGRRTVGSRIGLVSELQKPPESASRSKSRRGR
jgi:DNA-binding response OmpR family regulator